MAVKITPGQGKINLERALAQIETKVAKIGWLKGQKYEDHIDEHGKSTPGEYVATVAAIQIKGDPSQHIPARDFITTTIEAEKENWIKNLNSGVRAIFNGQKSITDVMEGTGQKAASDFKDGIKKMNSPPLSPRTIAARIERSGLSNKKKKNLTSKILSGAELTPQENKNVGGLTKPLIDTGHMRDTLTNLVDDA